MIRKLLMVAAATAVPMGVIATGVVSSGQAGAATVISDPPITCSFGGAVNFAPPGLSGPGTQTTAKTSTTTTTGLTYTSCSGGTGVAGPFPQAGGLAIVTKNTKCPKVAAPPTGTCVKPNLLQDQASGLANPATLTSLGKAVKKDRPVIQVFTFKLKATSESIISCTGGEAGFAINGTTKSSPKSTYTSFSLTVCLGTDFGGATTGNFTADLGNGITVPGVNIDPATSTIHIS